MRGFQKWGHWAHSLPNIVRGWLPQMCGAIDFLVQVSKLGIVTERTRDGNMGDSHCLKILKRRGFQL